MRGYPWLFGGLGLVFLLFGLVILVVQFLTQGIFLDVDQYWLWANFGLGVALIVAAVAVGVDELRERMSSSEARRVGKYGTSAVLSTVLAVVLLSLLAFLSTRYHWRWDWTETGVHQLSSQTLKVLEDLERDVEVKAFYRPLEAMRAREVLERYQYVSKRFHLEFIDPQARPGAGRELGIPDEKIGGGLVYVAIGDESVQVEELTEEKITNAIVSLTRRDQKKVYFVIGHNERAVEGEGAAEAEGFSFAADALRNENYRVETLLLASVDDVPEDADALVIAGPTRPLHAVEHKRLRRYVERGGALLVLLDPRANTDLYADLEEFGIEVGDDLVVDRVYGFAGQPALPFAAEYATHPITGEFRSPVLFELARSVQPAGEAKAAFTVLVRTSPESYAERSVERLFSEGVTEKGPDDLAGPVPVAVAGTVNLGEAGAGAESRLVVIGDADFAANGWLGQFANRDFFLNAVNWLLGDVKAISIRPSTARSSRLQLTSQEFMRIRNYSLFAMPEIIALVGVFAWWYRRHAPGR